MKKRVFSTELAYVLGMIGLAFSCAFAEKANLGLGIIVAPAYLVHLKFSPILPRFTFGVAGYTFEAILLVVMILAVRRFKIGYLFSFITAFLYGNVLDAAMRLIANMPADTLAVRIALFSANVVIACVSIALFFKTYISPEVYELFVMEVADRYHFKTSRVKFIYDISSCLLSVGLSFLFFGWGELQGLGVASFVSALINGPLISLFTRFFDRYFVFEDRLPLRKFFRR